MCATVNIRQLRKDQLSKKDVETSTGGQNRLTRLLNTDLSFRQGLPDRIKEGFYTELASMIKAGIDLRTALEIAIEALPKKTVKAVWQAILADIVQGATLSDALKATGKFTDYEYYTVQIGEESGRLVDVLKELSLFFYKRTKQRRLIIGALTYPATIVVVAAGAIVFMLTYVVPMFSDIFKRSGGDLPGVTRLVIALSAFFKTYTGITCCLIVGLAAAGYWQRKNVWMKQLSARIILSIPVWGKLTHKIYLAQFSQTIAMLLGSNVSILKAMQLTRLIVKLYPFQLALEQVEKEVASGASLHAALKKHPLFPLKLVAMIRVGEETNQLDYFFKQIADQLSDDVEHQSAVLGKFIEPAIIIILGLLVGVILIAMYLPLFQLGQQF